MTPVRLRRSGLFLVPRSRVRERATRTSVAGALQMSGFRLCYRRRSSSYVMTGIFHIERLCMNTKQSAINWLWRLAVAVKLLLSLPLASKHLRI